MLDDFKSRASASFATRAGRQVVENSVSVHGRLNLRRRDMIELPRFAQLAGRLALLIWQPTYEAGRIETCGKTGEPILAAPKSTSCPELDLTQ